MALLRHLLLVCFILISNKAFTQIQLNSPDDPLSISGHPKEDEINQKGYGEVTFIYNDFPKIYKGQFSNSLAHGIGVLNYANGDVYEGEFNDGKMHGYGTLRFFDAET